MMSLLNHFNIYSSKTSIQYSKMIVDKHLVISGLKMRKCRQRIEFCVKHLLIDPPLSGEANQSAIIIIAFVCMREATYFVTPRLLSTDVSVCFAFRGWTHTFPQFLFFTMKMKLFFHSSSLFVEVLVYINKSRFMWLLLKHPYFKKGCWKISQPVIVGTVTTKQ